MVINASTINENKQRALIFQGGGALGAYEAGIFKVLHDGLIDKAEKENVDLFDIVAGTSAGAINALLLVNYVIQNKTWRDSPDVLLNFWRDVSTSTSYFENTLVDYWQDMAHYFRDVSNRLSKIFFDRLDEYYSIDRELWRPLPFYYFWPDKFGPLATAESTRRYKSWLQFAFGTGGTHNVLSPAIFQPDFRFFNPFNFLLRYDNSPIIKTIEKYWIGKDKTIKPIKTKNGEPRLLIVAIDLQDATTVTFDSYPNEEGHLKSVYGDETKVKHEIYYDEGIEVKHLLAAISSHLRYTFPELKVETTYTGTKVTKERSFVDGFYLSNTPLREVLQSHRNYYDKVNKIEKVPSLDIIIGDLYPTLQKGTPQDPDSINNRVQDLLYHDKSKYDEKSAILVSDYIGTTKILWDYIQNKEPSVVENLKTEINKIIRSKNRKGEHRQFDDLIKGRFTIDNLIRIEYGHNKKITESDDIHGKAFEFSAHTIRDLIEEGKNDTLLYKSDWLEWL